MGKGENSGGSATLLMRGSLAMRIFPFLFPSSVRRSSSLFIMVKGDESIWDQGSNHIALDF